MLIWCIILAVVLWRPLMIAVGFACAIVAGLAINIVRVIRWLAGK